VTDSRRPDAPTPPQQVREGLAREGLAPAAPRGYRLRMLLAQGTLLWEALWPALWPALGIAGLFLALALFDVLPLLPGWLHALTLAVFAAGLCLALWRRLAPLRLPSAEAARRRLEQDSGFAHRPLAALDDRLAEQPGDPQAAALWQAHRQRLLAQARRLRLLPPRAGWARVDGYGLRAVVGLLLVIAAASTGIAWV